MADANRLQEWLIRRYLEQEHSTLGISAKLLSVSVSYDDTTETETPEILNLSLRGVQKFVAIKNDVAKLLNTSGQGSDPNRFGPEKEHFDKTYHQIVDGLAPITYEGMEKSEIEKKKEVAYVSLSTMTIIFDIKAQLLVSCYANMLSN